MNVGFDGQLKRQMKEPIQVDDDVIIDLLKSVDAKNNPLCIYLQRVVLS